MDSLWTIVAVMTPVAIVGFGIIVLVSLYDREVEETLDANDTNERWISLI
jgi:hypothetical protein